MRPRSPAKKKEGVVDSTTGARFIKEYYLRKLRTEHSEETRRIEEPIGRISPTQEGGKGTIPTQELCQTFDVHQRITRIVEIYDCF